MVNSATTHQDLHSFPTRRSSDLHLDIFVNGKHVTVPALVGIYANGDTTQGGFFVELHTHDSSGIMHLEAPKRDRKSTRLNSSHRCISYAVFCLKKKKKKT